MASAVLTKTLVLVLQNIYSIYQLSLIILIISVLYNIANKPGSFSDSPSAACQKIDISNVNS